MPFSEEIRDAANNDSKAIAYLQNAIASGEHWYRPLLKAIHLWSSTEEEFNGRRYTYLISGEAFDWLLLAERLIDEISSSVPEKEKINLLFFDKPPVDISTDDFKQLIGAAKYRAYLNFLYGVLSEEMLILATTREARKDQQSQGMLAHPTIERDIAFSRIYEQSENDLLHMFRKEKRLVPGKSITLTEMKEFLYWLFGYRVKRSEKSRVASDTRKALLFMQENITSRRISPI